MQQQLPANLSRNKLELNASLNVSEVSMYKPGTLVFAVSSHMYAYVEVAAD